MVDREYWNEIGDKSSMNCVVGLILIFLIITSPIGLVILIIGVIGMIVACVCIGFSYICPTNNSYQNNQPTYISQPAPTYNAQPYVSQPAPTYNTQPYVSQPAPTYNAQPYVSQPARSYDTHFATTATPQSSIQDSPQITPQETLKIDATFDPTMFIITSSLGQRLVQVDDEGTIIGQWPVEPNAESSSETSTESSSETIQQPSHYETQFSQPQRDTQRTNRANVMLEGVNVLGAAFNVAQSIFPF
jgi:hypothetical protein